MAFSFTRGGSSNISQSIAYSQNASNSGTSNSNTNSNNNNLSPNKLTSSQLNKSAKSLYPSWLKDNASCLKQLPGIYHGVLGQVQLQPKLVMSESNKLTTGLDKLVRQNQRADYMNRLTDTERVHQLLSTSRLSNEHLATIWAHVNKTFPGQLTNREVCLALALIAIFQRLDKDGLLEDDKIRPNSNNPFALVKLEKKAPVPTLYPNATSHKSSSSSLLPASNSMPNDLGGLLIDITGDIEPDCRITVSTGHRPASMFGDPLNLLDGDPQAGVDLVKLRGVWLKFMCSMKALFKRSFDILNVENGRSSALEAIKSAKGVAFCKNLCLCYPIAHNVSLKIVELSQFLEQQSVTGVHFDLLDKNYVMQINDLMISINEYWAVLINLFHESGQTGFIELIMDGLNRDNKTIESKTLDGLLLELNTMNKPNLCSLCHTKFYLVNIGDALEKQHDIGKADLELLLNNEPVSNDPGDECYFYHVKCANFWLNNVQDNEGGQLPFRGSPARHDEMILKPTSNNATQ